MMYQDKCSVLEKLAPHSTAEARNFISWPRIYLTMSLFLHQSIFLVSERHRLLKVSSCVYRVIKSMERPQNR